MKVSKKESKAKRGISLRLSQEEYNKVQTLSSQLGLSSSFVMREAIASFVKQNQ